MHSCYLLCAYVCNRITGGSHSSGIRSQGRGGLAGDPAAGGLRRRRTNSAEGTSRMPRLYARVLSERQAPEHSKPPMFYNYRLEFFMFDALGCRS
jgi:hypothetical protein